MREHEPSVKEATTVRANDNSTSRKDAEIGKAASRGYGSDGFSALQIRAYLQRYLQWWVQTSAYTWTFQDMVDWFVSQCWDVETAAWAAVVLQLAVNRSES